MGDTLTEVMNAACRLGQRTQSVRVIQDARPLFDQALATFTGGEDVHWWWERLPESAIYRAVADDRGFEYPVKVVPDPDEELLFVIEDDEEPFFPFLEATARQAQAIIEDSFAFEYYLIHPSFSWLVGESHHGQLFAFGSPVADRLAKLDLERAV